MTNIVTPIFVLQVFATFALTGLIWFVQVVHYPLFASVPDPHHAAYAVQHQTRTGWIVAPLMLVELTASLLSLWTVVRSPARGQMISSGEALGGFALVAVIWVSTTFLQVPIHKGLLGGVDNRAIRRLVRTNWVRTCAWTLRSLLLATCLLRSLGVHYPLAGH